MALRLLGRAIAHTGNEGPVELGKLEALYDGLAAGPRPAAPDAGRGACHAYATTRLTVERAPARRALAMRKNRNRRFTK